MAYYSIIYQTFYFDKPIYLEFNRTRDINLAHRLLHQYIDEHPCKAIYLVFGCERCGSKFEVRENW